MLLRAVVKLLECEVICGHERLDRPVNSCFTADLMSDVLAYAAPDALLITGLTTVQSVHTADIAECRAVLFVSGKRPSPEALALARTLEMPLLSTPRPLCDCCGVLFQKGLPPARKA